MVNSTLTEGLGIPAIEISRLEALAILDRAIVPVIDEYTPQTWPIGAAMLQFPSTTPRGGTVRDAGPDYWAAQFQRIKREGFDAVELPSNWLPIGEMDDNENADLVGALADVDLALVATSVVRRSIIDPTDADANLAATHRAIDAAVLVGSPLVCLGLHEALLPSQTSLPWFWTVAGPTNPADRGLWDRAVGLYQELASHAADVGVDLSLELYEGSFLGNCDTAVAFIHDIGRDNVGLNPDLGNLIRAQEPIEPWEAMAVKVLPHANYWHVKNYARAENPAAGVYLTTPTPLANGLIDYRKAIKFAIASGFRGAFLAENYGGDGLSVSAENARYLRRILADALTIDAV